MEALRGDGNNSATRCAQAYTCAIGCGMGCGGSDDGGRREPATHGKRSPRCSPGSRWAGSPAARPGTWRPGTRCARRPCSRTLGGTPPPARPTPCCPKRNTTPSHVTAQHSTHKVRMRVKRMHACRNTCKGMRVFYARPRRLAAKLNKDDPSPPLPSRRGERPADDSKAAPGTHLPFARPAASVT